MKIKGIDVSYHQGTIDWKKVKEDGVKFVVLREGYRKGVDAKFIQYAKGCKEVGLPIMVYHFIYTDGATIKENAESTVANLKKAGLDHTTTWIWTDLEYDTWKRNGETCTKAKCSAYIKEYIAELKALGCKNIGNYFNNDYCKRFVTADLLTEYPLWLADYTGEPDRNCQIQQYSSAGTVAGISGKVDMNYLFNEDFICNSNTEIKKEETTNHVVSTTTKEVKASVPAASFSKNLSGTYITTANLYCRDGAGIKHKHLCIIPKGTTVDCYGYYTTALGIKWLYIKTTVNGIKYIGFSSSTYLKECGIVEEK